MAAASMYFISSVFNILHRLPGLYPYLLHPWVYKGFVYSSTVEKRLAIELLLRH